MAFDICGMIYIYDTSFRADIGLVWGQEPISYQGFNEEFYIYTQYHHFFGF